jgi:hypothetical protein
MKFRAALLWALTTPIMGAQVVECPRPKPIYKVTKLSLTEVGISCNNGGDPTGRKIGDTLIISCGR